MMETDSPSSGSTERGAMGASLQPFPAFGLGGRANQLHAALSKDAFKPAASDNFSDTSFNDYLLQLSGEAGTCPDTVADEPLDPPTSSVQTSMRTSASPARVQYYVGGPREGSPLRGRPDSSTLTLQDLHGIGSTRCGTDLAPAFSRPSGLPPAASSSMDSLEPSLSATQHFTISSPVNAHVHADATTYIGKRYGVVADGRLHLDALTPSAASPFHTKAGGSGRSALLAFQALISIVLMLGLCGCSESLLMTQPEHHLVQSMAERPEVALHPRYSRDSFGVNLRARWLLLQSLACSDYDGFVFHCGSGGDAAIGYACVLSGAIRWLRLQLSVTKQPTLMAGDWSMGDIFRRWPPDIAQELASFSWPIDSISEFRRLLRCRLAAPVAIMGCEFTGAVRDAYSLTHGRVAISVDTRLSLTPGPHAILDLTEVLMLKVWLDAYLFPPCTHQVLSDTRAGMAKRQDGRSFWGIAFFIFCWCVVAHRVRMEQPNTIIPDYLFFPTQRLRPCDAGDADTKPINLYERGWGRLNLLPKPVEASSGHRNFYDFTSADERDRWRSSWARFPWLCACVVALTQQQRDADAALEWGWRLAGAKGHPCDPNNPEAVWGLPPPLDIQPLFLDWMERFAVAWYKAGLPVPADYLNGQPRPLEDAERRYQSQRGAGHGRRLAGVVPLSLRTSSTGTLALPEGMPRPEACVPELLPAHSVGALTWLIVPCCTPPDA